MSEMIKEFNKGDLLYIDGDEKAQWGFPEGYPYKDKNKTVIEWDGNTDGLYCVNDTWYLVSDEVISDDVLRNGTVTLITENVVTEMPVGPHWDTLVQQGLISEDVSGLMEGTVVVVRKPGVSMMGEGPFERTGTYFVNSYGTLVDKFVSETIHPMSPKFLPQATSTTPGAVKQALNISEIDAAPTAEQFNSLLTALENAGIIETE